MTTDEIIAYYVSLSILQYVGKPKAAATIAAITGPVVMDQLPMQVMNAYNLIGDNPAVGAQLDVLGKYAGVVRTGQGFNGLISLDDADFLTFIQMAIIKNNAGSSLATIQQLLNQFFPGEVLVFDTQDMSMSYLVSSTIGSQDLVQLFVTEGLLPKPMGVQLASTVYVPVINAFFGMTDASFYQLTRQIQPNASPFNTAQSYQADWPWLNANDAIGPNYQQALLTESGSVLDTESGIGIELE